MENIFGLLFANFLTDWQVKNHSYKTMLIKITILSFLLLIVLLVIHYHNFLELTKDMIFADLSISFITWLILLAISFLSIKARQILQEDLENPQ